MSCSIDSLAGHSEHRRSEQRPSAHRRRQQKLPVLAAAAAIAVLLTAVVFPILQTNGLAVAAAAADEPAGSGKASGSDGKTPAAAQKPANDSAPALPRSAAGETLNFDFETGTLRDWTATGDAFADQPIAGDTVAARRNDMRSNHAGEYWIGSFEKHGDPPQGTLQSAPFVVSHPWAGFLVAGGSDKRTRVEIVRHPSGEILFSTSGTNSENLQRVAVDLRKELNATLFIRLVDESSDGWGHINFDDFRFYSERPATTPRNASEMTSYAGLSPEDAAAAMTVPDGFRVSAFAGEPDVRQPIAMSIDDRGRLWVAEAHSYPVRRPAEAAEDQILIFEDTNNDGRFDTRRVFADRLNLVSGIELGFGGVFVGAAPELLFIPDRDGDDKPDGPPEVLLDGWGYEDTHETLNSFIWGPDGWLYGCHGVFTHSRVGKPGTPDDQRIPINAGIWRYHPIHRKFEVFAHGTSNPWGVDFDDRGQAVLTCCVIPHLFHVIQGARYQRQAGSHFNEFTYADIPTIAEHRHWIGNQWNDADRAASNDTGGGHAHAGAMIYLADTWPAEYRGKLLMNNIHGARINMDVLTPRGSGFVGRGAPDMIHTNDSWSQILYLRTGPDGNVFMIDWYDHNQCHHGNSPGHDRSNGRVFKVSYGNQQFQPVNMSQMSDLQLVDQLRNRNDWYPRQARRLLQERASSRPIDPAALRKLSTLTFLSGVRKPISETAKADAPAQHNIEDAERIALRALWCLHACNALSDEFVNRGLASSFASIRAWTIQLATELATIDGKPLAKPLLQSFVRLAETDPSPVVRLYLAALCQRIPLDQRAEILQHLAMNAVDTDDHNIPLMLWYSIEPIAAADPDAALKLAVNSPLPHLLDFTVRRIGALDTPAAFETLVTRLSLSENDSARLAILDGLLFAMQGRRNAAAPSKWARTSASLLTSANPEIRRRVLSLGIIYADSATIATVRNQLLDDTASLEDRRNALAGLLAANDPQLPAAVLKLLKSPLQTEAIRALAAFDIPEIADRLIELYPGVSADAKRDVLNTLCSRSRFAIPLLTAVSSGTIPGRDLSADLARQLRSLKSQEVTEMLEKVWGTVREAPADRAAAIADLTKTLQENPATPDELPLGRQVFSRVCQQCHTLFGEGGKVGPELTGSNRANLDYLLSNVMDPSAVLAREYMPQIVELQSGRVVTGIRQAESPQSLTLITANETLVVSRSDILEQTTSDVSMMPENLLANLSREEIRALVGYLASPKQVPQRANSGNTRLLFDGETLTGWIGDRTHFRVENGAIVGEAPQGIDRNEFLVAPLEVGDFRLTCEVQLSPNSSNSGIQFRSKVLPNGDVEGYQADIGAGWWGKLYEEHGRGLLWDRSGDSHVQADGWNRYEIVAIGSRIQTSINGKQCVDLDDPAGRRRGVIALQIHSGGPTTVRFRKLELTVLDDSPNANPVESPAKSAGK